MRIVSGIFRSRKLLLPPPSTTRPTSGRMREAIFNIIFSLNPELLKGAYVLDAFAGSGALGLEALSRGATQVSFLENNAQAIHALKHNITSLSVEKSCSVIVGDATKPPLAPHTADLIFLDPPYDQNLEGRCLQTLLQQGWIDAKTLIVLETSSKTTPQIPEGFTLLDQRVYGAA